MLFRALPLFLISLCAVSDGFVVIPPVINGNAEQFQRRVHLHAEAVELTVDLPPTGSDLSAYLKVEPCLSVPSEMIEVRYSIPFDLNVEPRNNLAVCTKDGPNGEKVGDILRFSSQWTLGLPEGEGLAESAAAFSGGLKWRCTLFDVLKARDWRQVVEALTSNLPSRTDEVVLIFERPLEQAPELS